MMEQKNYDSPTKSPVIQEIIMSNRIGAIAIHLAKQLNIDNVRALKLFYESKTCADLHDKSTGLYLYGDLYVPMSSSVKWKIGNEYQMPITCEILKYSSTFAGYRHFF